MVYESWPSWFTNHGLRAMVFESWFTIHSLRAMVYEPWFTIHSLRAMVYRSRSQPGYPSGHLKKTRNWQNLAAKIVNLVGSPKSLTSLSPGCLRCSFCCCMKECFWEMDIRGISKQMLCRITDDLVKEYKTLV